MRSLICSIPLLLAGCPKTGGAADPKVVEEPPAIEPEASVAVNDPEIVCGGPDRDRTVFVVELTYPEGCPLILSEYGGEIRDLEIEVSGDPARAYIVEPVDLATKKLAWAPAGCGADIQFAGAIGTLDLTFAATDSSSAEGKGTWTPTGGAPCELTVAGRMTNWAKPEELE